MKYYMTFSIVNYGISCISSLTSDQLQDNAVSAVSDEAVRVA